MNLEKEIEESWPKVALTRTSIFLLVGYSISCEPTLVGSLFNLSYTNTICLDQAKECITKLFTNGFCEATKDVLLGRAALDITHLKLIQLGVELFNIKDSDEALEIGNRIFEVEAIRVGD